MSISLGSVTIVIGRNSFSTPNTGLKGLVIGNVSGLSILVGLDGTGITKNLYPGTVDFFPIQHGYSGTIIMIASNDIVNANVLGSFVKIDAIGIAEVTNQSAYPMQLPPPGASGSATGRVRYSASVSTPATASNLQRLNIFNPATSKFNYVFDSARISTNDTGAPEVDLSYTTGADNALPSGGVAIVPHTIGGAATDANATYQDSAAGAIITGQFETFAMNISGIPQDFLGFPDQLIVPPGNNLLLSLISTAHPKAVTLTAKWTAVPI